MKLLREVCGANVPVRPLLFASVTAAAAAAAIYWCSKGGGRGKRRTEEDTSPGRVCETAPFQSTDNPQSQVMVSVNEVVGKEEKDEQMISELEKEKNRLMEEVKTLRDTVQEMGNLLCESNRENDKLQEEFENQKETHSKIQMEFNNLKKNMMCNEELQKVPVDEVEKKLRNAEEMISELEKEKISLREEVRTLRDTVQEIRSVRCDINTECEEMMKELEMEEETYSVLMKRLSQIKDTSMETETSQEVVTDDEIKRQKENMVHLQCEKVHLSVEVKTLWESVLEIGNLLCDTNMDYNHLMKEFESLREAHSKLQVEYNEFTRNGIHKEEFLKASVDESVGKLKAAEEMIVLLKSEKVYLSNEVQRIRDSLEDTGNLLYETNRDFDDLREELEKERDAYTVLQSEYEDLKNLQMVSVEESEEVKMLRGTVEEMGNLLADCNSDCDELKEEVEKEREAYLMLQYEYDELKNTLIRYEDFLNVYESKYKEKHQEVIAQLVNEKENLTEEVKTVQGTVEDLENLYIKTNKDCYKLLEEFRKERAAHRRLQYEHNQMMNTSSHDQESLIKEFEIMQDAHNVLQTQHEHLIKIMKHNEELLQEYEREQEAHSVLQFKYDEMVKDIMQKQEQMKIFLAKSVKHQRRYEETITRLSNDKLDLIEEVKSLLLCDTHLEYHTLKKEFEREQQTHNKLQVEFNQLKKAMMQNQELEKGFRSEAEEKEEETEELKKEEISVMD